MKLLLCGFGSIGKRHFANSHALIPDAEWTIVEPDRTLWHAGGRFIPELVVDSHYDAALICSPTHLHAEQIDVIGERARAFFIEKPVAHDRQALATIQRATAQRPTMVGCNYRFETGLVKVKELLADDAIGKPLSARAEFGQWLPSWRPQRDYRTGYAARRVTGGGVILDRIHELDYVTWLFGAPVAVKAMSGKLSALEIETEDTAEIMLRFASGAIASVHVDYLQREYTCQLKIVGERGTIEWQYRPTRVRVLRDAWQTVFDDPAPDVNAMYIAELRHFFAAIAAGAPPCNDVAEAGRTLDIALSALEQA